MSVVSVVTGVYNGMPYLPQAVESVLGQTLEDLEYIIVNDGSTDGTRAYLDSLSDPRVRVVHQENRGFAGSRNAGIALCRGEFVAIMDADDVSLPHRLERQVEFLRSRPEVAAVGSQARYLGPTGKVGRVLPLRLEPEEIRRELLAGGIGLHNATACIRTEVLRSVGGFRDVPSPDNDLYLRLCERHKLANLPEPLLLYRFHPGSEMATHLRERKLANLYNIHCFRLRTAGLPEPTFEEFLEHVRAWPWWKKAAWEIDLYALREHRRGIVAMLDGHPIRGVARLVWAALCSPSRAARRLRREFAMSIRPPRRAAGEH